MGIFYVIIYFGSVVGWRDFMLEKVVYVDMYVWILLIEDDVDDFGVIYLFIMWDNCFFSFFVIL